MNLLLPKNIRPFEYDTCEMKTRSSDRATISQKHLVARVKKALEDQGASRSRTKQSKPEGLSRTAEDMKLEIQNSTVTDSAKTFQGNPKPTPMLEEKSCSLSEEKEWSESRDLIEVSHIPVASSPEK